LQWVPGCTSHKSLLHMCNQTDDHACQVKIIIGTLTFYFRNNFMMEPSATLHPVKGSSAFIRVVSTVDCPKFFRFMCLYLPIPLHNKAKCRELQQKHMEYDKNFYTSDCKINSLFENAIYLLPGRDHSLRQYFYHL